MTSLAWADEPVFVDDSFTAMIEARSALSTEGRIYMPDGSVTYKSAEQMLAEEGLAKRLSYESALAVNPAFARLVED